MVGAFSGMTKWLDQLNLVCMSLCAILCLTIWGSIFYNHSFAAERKTNRLVFCDFAKYYVCAKIATSEDRHRAYDQKVQSDYTVRFALGDPKAPEEFIHYPPMDFPLTAPLAWLPIESAYLAFCLFGAAVFLAGTYALNDATNFCSKKKNLIFFWLAVSGSIPMLRTFLLGQSSVVLTGITALYIFALLKNRPAIAGIALALTSIKPQYTVFLAIPALAQRRYKLIIWAAISELVLILAAVATIGWQNIVDYPAIVLHAEQTSSLAGGFVAEMVNVRGLLAIFLDDTIAVKVSTLVFLFSWALLTGLWLKYSPKAPTSEMESVSQNHKSRLLLAMTVLFCLAFSPHTHLYDCLFIAVAVLAAGKNSITAALAISSTAKAEKIFAFLLLIYPIAGWFFLYLPLPVGVGAVRTAPFAVYNLILCAAACVALLSRRPAQS